MDQSLAPITLLSKIYGGVFHAERYGLYAVSFQTTSLESGRYVYDVLITASGGAKTRVVEGQVTVNPSVTR